MTDCEAIGQGCVFALVSFCNVLLFRHDEVQPITGLLKAAVYLGVCGEALTNLRTVSNPVKPRADMRVSRRLLAERRLSPARTNRSEGANGFRASGQGWLQTRALWTRGDGQLGRALGAGGEADSQDRGGEQRAAVSEVEST